jgi:hypothetical protein
MKKCQCAPPHSPLAALGSSLGIGNFGRLRCVKGPRTSSIPVLVGMLCLALCLLTQGCVGLGIEKTYTEVIRNPVVSDHRLRASDSMYATNPVCTSAWLGEHRGKPSSVRRDRTDHGDEVWTYRDGLLWNGITIFALVPVPLEVPTGSAGWTFVVRDGRVVHATRKWSHYTGGIVGFNVGPCGLRPFGAYSLNPESPSF